MVDRLCRVLAEPQSLQLTADSGLVQRNIEPPEDPLRQVSQPPAHHTVVRRDLTCLDNLGQRSAVPIVQLRRLARCLAVHQSTWPLGIEAQNPISNDLKPDPAYLSRITALAAVLDHRQRKKAPCLNGVIRRLRKMAKSPTIVVFTKWYRCTHGKPSIVCQGEPHLASFGNPQSEPHSTPTGISQNPNTGSNPFLD